MSRQVGLGPFAGHYAGDRIVLCDKWGSTKATVVGWHDDYHDRVDVVFDVMTAFGNTGVVNLHDLAHRAYGEVKI